MKKRIILSALIFAGLTGLTASCNLLDDCANCELVTIDANNNETRAAPMPFCGDDLEEKRDSSPVTFGGVTNLWVCD